MKKLTKKVLEIINKKCFKTQDLDYMEEYKPLAEALCKLEVEELFC